MPRNGRPPKPTSLHVLDGTLRPDRRHGVDEPTAEPGPCDPPAHLSADAAAVWERLSPEMISKGLLAPRYIDTFEAFCVAVVNMRKAAAVLDRDGLLIAGYRGQPITNPANTEFGRYSRLMRALGGELGLSPVATAVIGRGVGASTERTPDTSAARLLS
jgi:P27 family predicted phage terminase small subunit